jgi:hypothetical protein
MSYDPFTTRSLRDALGGYPTLDSLPDGLSDWQRLVSQTDAADRAFLRAGMFCDGAHLVEAGGFHPLLYALKQSTQLKVDRSAWIKAVKQDMWDAVRHIHCHNTGIY